MKIGKKLIVAGRKVHFAVSSRDDFNHELSEFGLTAPDDKVVVAARNPADQKFVMKEEFRFGLLHILLVYNMYTAMLSG